MSNEFKSCEQIASHKVELGCLPMSILSIRHFFIVGKDTQGPHF